MKKPNITVIVTDNPNRFEVKVKTSDGLSVFNVKAKDYKQAVSRYTDPVFSNCTMRLRYSS